MIAGEAERVQIPPAARDLSKERIAYLEHLAHQVRLTAVVFPILRSAAGVETPRKKSEPRNKAGMQKQAKLARSVNGSVSKSLNISVPPREANVSLRMAAEEEMGATQLTTQSQGA